ncbi:MAG: DUF447 family protein [Methanocellales archaeon]
MNLKSLGLSEGINEVIVTTISNSNKPNAAPIGLRIKRGVVSARIYKNTTTYKNIFETSALIGNIVDDPTLFITTAFSTLSKNHYIFKKNLSIPVLKKANAWVLFECEIKSSEEPALITLKPKQGEVLCKKVAAINRAVYAVIEAAIHATRYLATGEEKYKELIEYYATIIEKCGGNREKKAFKRLKQYLGE